MAHELWFVTTKDKAGNEGTAEVRGDFAGEDAIKAHYRKHVAGFEVVKATRAAEVTAKPTTAADQADQ